MGILMQAIDFDKEYPSPAEVELWARWGWELIRGLSPLVEMPDEVAQRVETRVLAAVEATDWASLVVMP